MSRVLPELVVVEQGMAGFHLLDDGNQGGIEV